MPAVPPLTWRRVADDRYESDCGRFLLARVTLPSGAHEWLVRRVGRHGSRSPDGYHVAIEVRLDAAQATAERHAWREANSPHVPDDYAARMETFYWPISDGTSRGALAIVEEDGRRVARVVIMSRDTDDYVAQWMVELDLDPAEPGKPAEPVDVDYDRPWTATQHRTRADELLRGLAWAWDGPGHPQEQPQEDWWTLARAQAHATLAQC